MTHGSGRPPVAGPAGVAVLVSELQRGVVGDLVPPNLSQLADAVAQSELIVNAVQLLDGARAHGVPVVHMTLQFRPDRVGFRLVTPLQAVTMRDPEYLLVGSDQAQVLPELGLAPSDIVHARTHGMSAFTGTDLDAILRSLDVDTVIIAGVSLNEAVFGAAIEAVNLGYRVMIPRDATVGLPQSFAEDMLRHVFAPLATIVTVEQILEAWTKVVS